MRFQVPDVASVFLNGAVRREHAHACHVQDRFLDPRLGQTVKRIHPCLGSDVGIVVGQQLVMVATRQQGLDDIAESSGFVVTESPVADGVQV